ncbi:hypothetical protein PVL29_018998 [Vitis rotundifolia]|uniref:Uncharacterized protein n=1 Tax=Vitis rotundifolia TaxID=103349 RepID=A0AA38Z6C9_VITRO|nr:hypothetical protein PVL29_018998 [Vitis rotundifolia]
MAQGNQSTYAHAEVGSLDPSPMEDSSSPFYLHNGDHPELILPIKPLLLYSVIQAHFIRCNIGRSFLQPMSTTYCFAEFTATSNHDYHFGITRAGSLFSLKFSW